MITIPKLSKQEADNINVMKKMAGWSLVHRMIEDSIKFKNAALINFNWKFDGNGDPDKKDVLKFKDLQKETGILKQFLMFIDKAAIIGENKDKSIYE